MIIIQVSDFILILFMSTVEHTELKLYSAATLPNLQLAFCYILLELWEFHSSKLLVW